MPDDNIPWQLVSQDNNVFDVLKDSNKKLITTIIKCYLPIQMEILQDRYGFIPSYQTRLYTGSTSSEVICVYDTKEEAIKGHNELVKKFNIR